MIGVATASEKRRSYVVHAYAALLSLGQLSWPRESKLVDDLTPSPDAFDLSDDVRLYFDQNANAD